MAALVSGNRIVNSLPRDGPGKLRLSQNPILNMGRVLANVKIANLALNNAVKHLFSLEGR